MRNPLTAVKGFLQLLKRERPHPYLDIAYDELEVALNTMQNLLNVSKPDAADEPSTTVRIGQELESLLYLFQDQMYRVALDKRILAADACVLGKKGQLRRALFNLLKNAFESIPEAGTIGVRQWIEGEHAVIAIADSGVGIPKEKLPMLGTPFFTSKGSGTGLGLTQAYAAIYEHGGSIQVHSEVDRGTTFTVRLPLQLGSEAAADAPQEQPAVRSFAEFVAARESAVRDRAEGLFAAEGARDASIRAAVRALRALSGEDESAAASLAGEHGREWAAAGATLCECLAWFRMVRKLTVDALQQYGAETAISSQELCGFERRLHLRLDAYLERFFEAFDERGGPSLVVEGMDVRGGFGAAPFVPPHAEAPGARYDERLRLPSCAADRDR